MICKDIFPGLSWSRNL